VRKELRGHDILPKWQVEAEAERLTGVWLTSIEGRQAVRHAAWAAVNRGQNLDTAVEPDAPALASAGEDLKKQRLDKLLGAESPPPDGGSAFSEMLSHKLFGEYLRETLASAREWKKSNIGSSLSKCPRRTFSDWLERRSEQEKRNRETVEQWRKHKRRQLGQRQIAILRVATVSSVLEQLRSLESSGYLEVAEKSGPGKMRKSARKGLRFLEKMKVLKGIGRDNAEAALRESGASSRGGHGGGADKEIAPAVAWISFEQFLQVMEPSLFSLKAHPGTRFHATNLLAGKAGDGSLLFKEDSDLRDGKSVPAVVVESNQALVDKEYERVQAFEAWKNEKDTKVKLAAEKKEREDEKRKKKKSSLKKESKKAVTKWKKKIAARPATKAFRPKQAWTNVAAAFGEEEEEEEDGM
jgi:hypothetical protein